MPVSHPIPPRDEPACAGSDLLDDLLRVAAQNPLFPQGPAAPRRPGRGRRRELPAEAHPSLADVIGLPGAMDPRDLLEQATARAIQSGLFGGLDPTVKDIQLVAQLAQCTVDDDGSESVQRLAARFGQEGRDTLDMAVRVRQLVKHRVLSVRRNDPATPAGGLSLVGLLHSQVRLSERSLGIIFREPVEALDAETAGDGPDALLEAAFRLVRPLRELLPQGPHQRQSTSSGARRVKALATFGTQWAELTAQAAADGQPFPLADLVTEAGLDVAETAVLVYLLEESIGELNCSVMELSTLVAGTGLARLRSRLFEPQSRLIQQGLVRLDENPFSRSGVILTEQTIARLTGEPTTTPLDRLNEMLAEQDILELAEPGPAWEDLVVEPGLQETLETLARGLEGQAASTLAEWGLKVAGRAQGRVLLFSGPSGTGKTLAARALARRLDVPVLATDSARILSRWVGESQQNVAQIFRLYARACKAMGARPLLLLDEADQLLGRRQAGGESVDRMYSQMQNLFLEALDTFDGLLVATTNLPDALDKAFLRRFDAKLTFARPTPVERRRIWDLHLPTGVPRLEDLHLDELSGEELTGGQIAVAARLALQAAALRGDGLRRADLVKAARSEMRGTAGCDEGKPLGFGRC